MTEASEEVSKGKKLLLSVKLGIGLLPVYNTTGQLIGSACLEGIAVDLNLDRNQPESLDLEVQPGRLHAKLRLQTPPAQSVTNGEDASVWIVLEGI